MRIQFQIMTFFILLNIAIFFIASTGFFKYTFAGDAFTFDVDDPEYDINDPSRLPSPDKIFERLMTNVVTGSIAEVPYLKLELTFPILMTSLVIISIAIGVATKSTNGVAMMIVGSMFVIMWQNSRRIIDSLTSGLDSSVNYLILMFLVIMMISFVILVYDTASGQRSTK